MHYRRRHIPPQLIKFTAKEKTDIKEKEAVWNTTSFDDLNYSFVRRGRPRPQRHGKGSQKNWLTQVFTSLFRASGLLYSKL